MPKITVNEVDQSRYIAPGSTAPLVVLVPGTASFGPTFTAENPRTSTFEGASDLTAFYTEYGLMPATITNGSLVAPIPGDISFDYVTNLLNKGATVKFFRINEGSYAKTMEIANGVSISAKYTGKLGNYLTVALKSVSIKDKNTGDVNHDLVVTVYRTSTLNTASTEVDISKLNKYNAVESYRVSSDINSPYYENVSKFEFIQISNSIVSDIIDALGNTNQTKAYAMAGGLDFANAADDGSVSELDIETATTALMENLTKAYANFKDPYLFDFDFVVSGGFINDNTSDDGLTFPEYVSQVEPMHQAMIELCEVRGDAVALLDTPHDMTHFDVITYRSNINTSYAAMYAPWCSSVSASTGRTIMMPPSYNFLQAILYGMSSATVENQLWYVPAGVTRASAPFIINPKYEIGSIVLDEFQNNHDYRVNPIMRVRNYGYCVYGNATCQNSISGASNSALESLNVRLISNVIKKTIFAVCCGLSFEYNDSRLWTKFYSQMDTVLTYMKRHFGLYDYKIIMDTTTVTAQAMNERRVPGKIKISPQLAGEFFDIDFEIAPSGVSFSEEAFE